MKKMLVTGASGFNPDCVFLRLTWMYDPALTNVSQHSDFFTNLLPKLYTEEEIAYAVYDKRGITDVLTYHTPPIKFSTFWYFSCFLSQIMLYSSTLQRPQKPRSKGLAGDSRR